MASGCHASPSLSEMDSDAAALGVSGFLTWKLKEYFLPLAMVAFLHMGKRSSPAELSHAA
jgi:hypothetical protein